MENKTMNFMVCVVLFLIFMPFRLVKAENNDETIEKHFNFDQALTTNLNDDANRSRVNVSIMRANHEGLFLNSNKVLTSNFKDEGCHFVRAMKYFHKMNIKSAIREFDKTIAINPNYPQAYYYRGVNLILNDDFERGWNDIRKAQQIGFNINLKMLNILERYTSSYNRNKVSPELENVFDKLQWTL